MARGTIYDTDNSCHSLFSNHPSVVEKNRLDAEEKQRKLQEAEDRAERKKKKKEELDRIMVITKFEARRKRNIIRGNDGESTEEKEEEKEKPNMLA